jgi:hypothetical protein
VHEIGMKSGMSFGFGLAATWRRSARRCDGQQFRGKTSQSNADKSAGHCCYIEEAENGTICEKESPDSSNHFFAIRQLLYIFHIHPSLIHSISQAKGKDSRNQKGQDRVAT